MARGRRSMRRQAVMILYQQDLLGLSPIEAFERGGGPSPGAYAESLVTGVDAHKEEIDSLIRPHLSGWKLERLGVLERAIMRLATYELLWERDVPAAVVINEAVELAKRYCSDEAAALVNGVLGTLTAAESERIARERL